MLTIKTSPCPAVSFGPNFPVHMLTHFLTSIFDSVFFKSQISPPLHVSPEKSCIISWILIGIWYCSLTTFPGLQGKDLDAFYVSFHLVFLPCFFLAYGVANSNWPGSQPISESRDYRLINSAMPSTFYPQYCLPPLNIDSFCFMCQSKSVEKVARYDMGLQGI